MMLFPFKRRTIRRSQPAGTAFAATEQGRGLITFDRFGETDTLRDRFELLISVAYTVAMPLPVAAVNLQFYNPTPDPEAMTGVENSDRMVLFTDATGTLTSFIENNDGAWWPVPWREKPDLPYELRFTDTAVASARTLLVELVWVPRWPCAGLSDYLARLAQTDPRRVPGTGSGGNREAGSFSIELPDPEG